MPSYAFEGLPGGITLLHSMLGCVSMTLWGLVIFEKLLAQCVSEFEARLRGSFCSRRDGPRQEVVS